MSPRLHVIDTHTGGEPTRVIVAGGPDLGAGTLAQRRARMREEFDGYRTARLPANLLQAQRDYFGAHTYERTDKPRGQFFHTNWTGRGGTTASTTYNV